MNDIIKWNEVMRGKGIGTIVSQTLGLYGYTFCDFGDSFMVHDEDGERTRNFIVILVEKMEDHIVITIHEDKRHTFGDNSYVNFREIQGSEELNSLEPQKIQVIDGFRFKVMTDPSKISDYTIGGIVEDVKVPQLHKFNSLKDAINRPLETATDGMFMISDYAAFERPGELHIAFQAIQAFNTEHSRFPGDNQEDVDAVIKLAEAINEDHKKTEGNFSLEEISDSTKEIIAKAARYSTRSVSPMAAFHGGIAAQEIVKFTGKYTPCTQFFHNEFFGSLPKTDVERKLNGDRYDDQVAIYGNEVQEKLKAANIFMVGAGALGCELVKAYALMGVGCGKDGLITCTDNDNIEVSNLNRQFLFRKNNVGHAKSETACTIAK